jgi:uncharacterized damage-inducible protein DinB
MKFRSLIDEYLAGPGALRAAVAGMSAEQLDAAPIPGRWSTRQVVCHIADAELLYADRIKRVLAEEQPTLMSMDPDRYTSLMVAGRDVSAELDLVENVRRQVGAILQTLDDAQFERIGNHSVAGPQTLERIVRNVTGHIPHHIPFIAEKRAALGC